MTKWMFTGQSSELPLTNAHRPAKNACKNRCLRDSVSFCLSVRSFNVINSFHIGDLGALYYYYYFFNYLAVLGLGVKVWIPNLLARITIFNCGMWNLILNRPNWGPCAWEPERELSLDHRGNPL